jgi:integrase/recombinase XerD
MYNQDEKTAKSNVFVTDKEEIVISSFDANNQEKNSNEYLINSDSKILFCPDCGERDFIKAGKSKIKDKQQYRCKKCNRLFLDPKLIELSKRRIPKISRDKYFDPNILCCPECGSNEVRKHGIYAQNKQQYQCKNKNCRRIFIDPKLREIKERTGIKCRFCNSENCVKGGFVKSCSKQAYICKDCGRKFDPDAKVDTSPKLSLSEDVWDGLTLAVQVPKTLSTRKLNFSPICQPWLKELSKKFIRFKAVNSKFNTISGCLKALRKFSRYLHQFYPEINCIEEINREIIVNYVVYLNSDLRPNTINDYISKLQSFLETGHRNNWFHIDLYLISSKDYSKVETKPRYIPKIVTEQLQQHKHLLPRTIEIMVSLFLETGFRYSTLATIPVDCLEQDYNGKWWIYRKRVKIPDGFKSPISDRLVEEIKEQQFFIKQYFEDNKYLFAPRAIGTREDSYIPQKNEPVKLSSYLYYLNKLAIKLTIKDDNGKVWKFSSHQFRHTFATEAINSGVPQHIVQKLLGHKSPEMTMIYAHIHDTTMLKELAKFQENRIIDITGQFVSLELEADTGDLEWFTNKICAIALPNGYCGRPRIEGDCDIAGDVGCYLCPHFRTNKDFVSVHKDQLERINEVLAKAYKYNWQLPIKKNEAIRQNLELIIMTLEKNDNKKTH